MKNETTIMDIIDSTIDNLTKIRDMADVIFKYDEEGTMMTQKQLDLIIKELQVVE